MSRFMHRSLLSWVILCSSFPVWADDAEDKSATFVGTLGGTATRDENLPGNPVITVFLVDKQVTDAGLKELAGLKNLTRLVLVRAMVTDAGMKELAALKNLTDLSLGGTKVTDAGLKELAKLKSLAKLDLTTLQTLNGRIQVGGEAPQAVAIDWLKTNGFLK